MFVVQLLSAEEKYIRATALLSMIANHPVAHEGTKTDALNKKAELRKLLADDAFQAAWERGKQLDLDDVISDLMER